MKLGRLYEKIITKPPVNYDLDIFSTVKVLVGAFIKDKYGQGTVKLREGSLTALISIPKFCAVTPSVRNSVTLSFKRYKLY